MMLYEEWRQPDSFFLVTPFVRPRRFSARKLSPYNFSKLHFKEKFKHQCFRNVIYNCLFEIVGKIL